MDSFGPSSLPRHERDAIHRRAAAARSFARGLVAHCLRVRLDAQTKSRAPDATRENHRVCLDAERALRCGVKEFVSLLRQVQTPPETAVIEVKDLVRDGIEDAARASPLEERQLIDCVVGWAIEDYFAADGDGK